MRRMSRMLLPGCVVALALTTAASFAASQSQSKPDKSSGSAATQPTAPTSARPEEPGSLTRPGRDAKDRLNEQGLEASETEAQVLRKIMLEEAKHRKRVAAIKRLRELATEQGNESRLQALDKLEAKLTSLYERKTDRWRQRLGTDKYAQLQDRLHKGKGPGKGRGPSFDKGRSEPGDVSSTPGKGKPGTDLAGQQQPPGAPSGAAKGQPQSGDPAGSEKGQSGPPIRSRDDRLDKEKGKPQGSEGKDDPGAEKGKGGPGSGKGKDPAKGDPKGQKGGG
jgi:hypothetical protein